MEVRVSAPAALNGEVRTIPVIDKTLTNEGQAADAKATGNRLDGQAALIEEHGRKIADNAAVIQALRAENGTQDTKLGEHKILIDNNDQKIAAAENRIGELERKASEAEAAIVTMQEKDAATDETIAGIYEQINETAADVNANFNMITQEIQPELATVQNDIEVIKERNKTMQDDIDALEQHLDTTATSMWTSVSGVLVNDCWYGVSGNVCTVWLGFTTTADIAIGTALFVDLPKPKYKGYFSVYDINGGRSFPLHLMKGASGGAIATTEETLESLGRYVGNITYIVEDETTV